MQTHWGNRHYTLCYPSFTALLHWENVRYAYYSTKDWISYWIHLYTRVRRNIVEDDEFHEHIISSEIHIFERYLSSWFRWQLLFQFNTIGNTDVSMWKEVLMKYYGENVYRPMTYHKVDDIPIIWLSILSLIWYLQLNIVASRWFEIN